MPRHPSGNENGDDIALALSFEDVVEELENTVEVFDSVREWVKYVGIVSDKPAHALNGFYARNDEINIDFSSGPGEGKLEGLKRTRERKRFDAERYIFVSATKRD
ncbi:MAG: hypothetical protein SXQ77_01760, partial [Halobacteria archaeon]|nr:hypothetical protein [Halobacteria archaeon]